MNLYATSVCCTAISAENLLNLSKSLLKYSYIGILLQAPQERKLECALVHTLNTILHLAYTTIY